MFGFRDFGPKRSLGLRAYAVGCNTPREELLHVPPSIHVYIGILFLDALAGVTAAAAAKAILMRC